MGENLYQSLSGIIVGFGAALAGIVTLFAPLLLLNIAPPLAATTPVTLGGTVLSQNQVVGAILTLGGFAIVFYYVKKQEGSD